jgi:hypothetical protein
VGGGGGLGSSAGRPHGEVEGKRGGARGRRPRGIEGGGGMGMD